jgi:low affinity Fe/Cu permease
MVNLHISHKPPHRTLFFKIAKWVSSKAGEPVTFCSACMLIVLWGFLGPVFHFSDSWQLVINTATTIITFLMVFLIQHTQNRDILAVHLKLNELIRAVSSAHNSLMEIEELSEEELKAIDKKYKMLRASLKDDKRKDDTALRLEAVRRSLKKSAKHA